MNMQEVALLMAAAYDHFTDKLDRMIIDMMVQWQADAQRGMQTG